MSVQYLSQLKKLSHRIQKAKNLVLTTHKICDGDGLGAMLGMYHALVKMEKPVRAISVDKISNKYRLLDIDQYTENFEQLKDPIKPTELALVFDTNDYRRIQPLYDTLHTQCEDIIYIDHHVILEGLKISEDSIVVPSAASTGEICYFLLKEMGISIDPRIATALYVSIVFDTQRFRFIKRSPISHTICSELCKYIEDNESLYNHIFGVTSLEKMNLLAKTIQNTEYFYKHQVALLWLTIEELNKYHLSIEDACDFLDMTLEVDSTQLAVLIVPLSKNEYKLSFRSKKIDVSKVAGVFKGGGHKFSSGASLKNYEKNLKQEILKSLESFFK